jgi:hypothetical protein
MQVEIIVNQETLKVEVFFCGEIIGTFDTLDEATHEYEFAEVISPSPKELVIS